VSDEEEIEKLVEEAAGLTKHQIAMQTLASDPEWLARNAEGHRKMAADPVWRTNNAEGRRKRAANPVWRARNAHANRKRAIVILCVETSIVYESARDVERKMDISNPAITAVCKGHRKTAGGYHWRYATPEEVAEFKKKEAKIDTPKNVVP